MTDIERMQRAEARELLMSYKAQVKSYGKEAADAFVTKALKHTKRRWGSDEEVRGYMRKMMRGEECH